MDIGMEQHDASLGYGQDDIFDLTGAERGMKKKGGVTMLSGDGYDMSEDSDEGDVDGEEDELLDDSDEERERKVAGLEAELDGMYDVYQERLKERDAKFKVTEERRKHGLLEEWHGIQKKDSDEEDSGSEEGGWDKLEEAKAKAGDDSSSSDDSDAGEDDQDEDNAPTLGQKRGRDDVATPKSKRVKLLTKLEEPKSAAQASRAAQIWFSQDIFNGMGDFKDIEDDEDEDVSMDGDDDKDEDEDENENEDDWQDEVRRDDFSKLQDCRTDGHPGTG